MRLGPGQEPQVASEYPMSLAHARWADDPRGSMDALAAWVADDPNGPSTAEAARELARMALRLGDRAALEQAARIYAGSSSDYPAPIFRTKAQWVEAMAGGSDHLAVEAAAEAFERLGYPVDAADAWADAAIMAARAGIASEAEDRACSLCESMGMHPLLGPLPETRWISGQRGRHAVRATRPPPRAAPVPTPRGRWCGVAVTRGDPRRRPHGATSAGFLLT